MTLRNVLAEDACELDKIDKSLVPYNSQDNISHQDAIRTLISISDCTSDQNNKSPTN